VSMSIFVRRLMAALACSAALTCLACGGTSSTSPAAPTSSPASPAPSPDTPLPSLSVMLSEKTVGSASAPVTMIAYSSLTCSHCADFHVSTYRQIKSAYIDTGRVKFVFRDFPLNEAAIVGAMVARCAGDNYFTVLDALFSAQVSWAYAADYTAGIKKVVAPLGMTSNDVDACAATTALRDGVLAIKSGGSTQFGVNGTPTFLINGQKVVGAVPFADFAAVIDAIK
jgi:protein-disulfide isomerase